MTPGSSVPAVGFPHGPDTHTSHVMGSAVLSGTTVVRLEADAPTPTAALGGEGGYRSEDEQTEVADAQ